MADFFQARLDGSLNALTKQFADKVQVPKDRQFIGLDAYRKAIDSIAPGGLAILTTPPAFRPIHVEYAISKGCHVFMEKSFGVDAPASGVSSGRARKPSARTSRSRAAS